MKSAAIRALAGLVCLLLAACGGGGGGSGGGGGVAVGNRPPTAAAGAAQTVATGALVTFDGSGSSDPDGDALTYAWTLTSAPAGSAAALAGATTAKPTLRADVDGTYAVSLTVNDGHAASAAAATSATATTDPSDRDKAQRGVLAAGLDAQQTTVYLTWNDSFPAGASYRVEQQGADGKFVAVETLAGLGGPPATGAPPVLRWSRAFTGAATFRVIAISGGREIPLLTQLGASTVSVAPLPNYQIAIDQPSTLSGTAKLSITPATAPPIGVGWFLDLDVLGSGDPFDWDTTKTPNGQHQLLARVYLANSTYIDLRKDVTTSNANLALSAAAQQNGATFSVYVAASSAFGIANVQLAMDGGAFQTLTAKNGCPSGCSAPNYSHYVFTFNSSTLGSGSHTATIKTTDNGGNTKQITLAADIYNAPIVSLSVKDGSFWFGRLDLTGSYTTDLSTPLTVKAQLGSTNFLTTTATSFSGGFDLTGLPSGTYTLTVSVTNSSGVGTYVQKQIIVVPAAALALQPLYSLPAGMPVYIGGPMTYTQAPLAAYGDLVVYGDAAGLRIRDVAANTDRALISGANAPTGFTGLIFPAADTLYGVGKGTDCASSCVYRITPSTGAAANVSTPDPAIPAGSTSVISSLSVRGRYAAWWNFIVNGQDSFKLYDATTGALTTISKPAGVDRMIEPMLELSGGEPVLVFTVTTGSSQSIYKWTQSAGAVQVVAGARPIAFDGATIAYIQNGALYTIPVTGGAATQVDAANVVDARLQGGVLAWLVGANFPKTLKARSPTLAATTVTADGAALLGIVSGDVIHVSNSAELWTWNATTGASTRRVYGQPVGPILAPQWVYFRSGESIYRVPID